MPVPNSKNTLRVAFTALLFLITSAGQSLLLSSSNMRVAAHEMKPSPSHSPAATGHSHQTVEIPAGQQVPTLNLIIHPDAVKGWNLEVKVTNFTFAPERVNTKSASVNEGHAHLYVNGKKISRLYSTWFHLENLPPGIHNVTVSLNTNDHGELRHQGKPIRATATIQVPK